jgi:hypothetical protein
LSPNRLMPSIFFSPLPFCWKTAIFCTPDIRLDISDFESQGSILSRTFI